MDTSAPTAGQGLPPSINPDTDNSKQVDEKEENQKRAGFVLFKSGQPIEVIECQNKNDLKKQLEECIESGVHYQAIRGKVLHAQTETVSKVTIN